MKLAITGKGGVGKTTICAILSFALSEKGFSVLAIDADPDSHLASVMGFPKASQITPLSEMNELISERTGQDPRVPGTYFRLNPKVSDLPERLWVEHLGIRLMVMGGVKRGGGGCACPENVLLKNLVAHLLLERKEVVILDMVAGIEHLGRATAKAVDKLLVVVEPSRRSLETTFKIRNLAKDIGLENIGIIGNKLRAEEDKEK